MEAGAQSFYSVCNNSIGCSPMHRDVGELFPGKCGRPLANRTPPLPAKPGHCRQGPPMSNKKGPLLPLRQREDETDASVFLSLHLSPDAHRRKKKKEREEGKQSVAFWGVPPPTPLLPRRSCVEEKRGGLGHVIGRACGHGSAPRQREQGLLHD